MDRISLQLQMGGKRDDHQLVNEPHEMMHRYPCALSHETECDLITATRMNLKNVIQKADAKEHVPNDSVHLTF
jgi:hypothetical protein